MNTRAPLFIPWDDGCWEHVHPDLLYVPHGFAGYPYWMIFTPYPRGDDRFENPTLRASQDGLAFVKVPGIPEPVVPAPEDPELHHADPDLVFHNDCLHVIYATIRKKSDETTFNIVSSRDGLMWSKPRIIYRDISVVSPACVIKGDLWRVWFIRHERNQKTRFSAPSELLCRQGASPTRLGDECLCHLSIPRHILWHVDVQIVDDGYEALVAAFPKGTDSSRTRLFHAVSRDGLRFVLSPNRAILAPSTFGWDNRTIYRSTFLRQPGGVYRIWYSGASWGFHFGIGHLQGPLDALEEDTSAPIAPIPRLYVRFWQDLMGSLVYQASNNVPEPALSIIRRLRRLHAKQPI